jgi:PAS domain-containing serine/threonine kinase
MPSSVADLPSMGLPELTPSVSFDSIDSGGSPATPALTASLDERAAPDMLSVPDDGLGCMNWPPPEIDSSSAAGDAAARPGMNRRPSYDLFECIEQSPHKRVPEDKAQYIFAQVVEAIYYLHSVGIVHRDIKDENVVIDNNFRVISLPVL